MENSNVLVGAKRILGHESQNMTTEISLHGLGESERQAVDTHRCRPVKKSHTATGQAI